MRYTFQIPGDDGRAVHVAAEAFRDLPTQGIVAYASKADCDCIQAGASGGEAVFVINSKGGRKLMIEKYAGTDVVSSLSLNPVESLMALDEFSTSLRAVEADFPPGILESYPRPMRVERDL